MKFFSAAGDELSVKPIIIFLVEFVLDLFTPSLYKKGFLVDWQIQKAIASGLLKIEPSVQPWQLQTMSIDLRLGCEILVPITTEEFPYIDLRERFDENTQTRRVKITTDAPYLLFPGDFVLAYTLESIQLSATFGAFLEGKSRNARAGLNVHKTAPLIQPGSEGRIMLEISTDMPVALYAEMPVAQLVLFRLPSTPRLPYRGAYWGEGLEVCALQ